MRLPAPPELLPESRLLREMFARDLGWRAAAGEPREVEVDGRRLLLVPLAARPPAVALLCEPLSGASLPGYAARRRIRARLRRLFPRSLAIFTDAAHSVQLWSWEGRDAGGPLACRELPRRPGHADAEWLRRARSIAREMEEADRPPARRRPADHPGRPLLVALLRRVRRLHPRAFAPGAPLAGAPGAARSAGGRALGQRVQDAVEGTSDPALPRALWRALGDIAVLDPACGAGGWLLAAMETLEPVYAACLERMASWVEEVDDPVRPGRGGRLAGFRAVLERAADPARFPSRRHFAREAIVLRTLHGADPDAEALAAAELALLLRLRPTGDGATPAPAGIACNLREGDLSAGFRAAAEVADAIARHGGGGSFRELEEEVETVDRAERRLREMRLAGGAGAEETLAGWEAARRRRLAISARLDLLRARAAGIDPAASGDRVRPLHRWAEHHGVLRRGGFALERGGGR